MRIGPSGSAFTVPPLPADPGAGRSPLAGRAGLAGAPAFGAPAFGAPAFGAPVLGAGAGAALTAAPREAGPFGPFPADPLPAGPFPAGPLPDAPRGGAPRGVLLVEREERVAGSAEAVRFPAPFARAGGRPGRVTPRRPCCRPRAAQSRARRRGAALRDAASRTAPRTGPWYRTAAADQSLRSDRQCRSGRAHAAT